MSRRLDRDHYVLLKNSKVIEDHQEIKILLHENEEITDKLINTLTPEMQNTMKNVVPELILLAEKEWVVDIYSSEDLGEDENDWIYCGLCGRQKNRYVHYIKNTQNDNIVNVGSTCITKFTIIDNQGMTTSEFFKRSKNIQKINELNNRFPGIINKSRTWYNAIQFCSLILPFHIETPYLKLGELLDHNINYFIDNHLSKHEKEQIYKDIEDIFSKERHLLQTIEDYVEENRDKKFIAKGHLRTWCTNRSDSNIILNGLKEEGVITYKTAHRIVESDFMKTMVKELNKCFAPLGFLDWVPLANEESYLTQCSPLEHVRITIPHGLLLRRFGNCIFDASNELPNKEDVLKLCKPVEQKGYYELIVNLSKALKKSGIIYYNQDFYFNEVIYYLESEDKYIITKLTDFVHKFYYLAYESDPSLQEIAEYISNPSLKRHNKKDIDDHIAYFRHR